MKQTAAGVATFERPVDCLHLARRVAIRHAGTRLHGVRKLRPVQLEAGLAIEQVLWLAPVVFPPEAPTYVLTSSAELQETSDASFRLIQRGACTPSRAAF